MAGTRGRRRAGLFVAFNADGQRAGPDDIVTAFVPARLVERSARRRFRVAAAAANYLGAAVAVFCLLAVTGVFVVGWWLGTPDLRLAWGIGAWALIILGWALRALEPGGRRP